MINLDALLEEAYWGLRKASMLHTGEDRGLALLVRDTYSLLNNIETIYTLDASSFFKDDVECKTYYFKYIKPLMYTLKILKKINITTTRRRTIMEFAKLYSLYLPCLSVFKSQAADLGLPEPSSYNYEISEKWAEIAIPIPEFARNFAITDWRIKHANNYSISRDDGVRKEPPSTPTKGTRPKSSGS